MNKEKLAEIYKRYNDIIGLQDGRISMDNHMLALAHIQDEIVKEQEELVQVRKDLEDFKFFTKLDALETGYRSDNIINLVEEFCLWKAKL